ncbi:antitoxin [Zooshikella harenae]|uniref:AbrB/MazE/SpoVT family DNA-binding domain-containing protein n=1 Tax=Zooshikella harenae TaxID=2827238 RepID=A0ABS5ZJQ7_9GAMM|nr:AbrB/MazE/SpoVT family DNA-binding domain-containing protein [Zooshikella harenae]MBU2714319.1 AbrB/MazE/SpoVT family DNA-binding domain-containing protein [Zooshikella harenae]
MTQKVKLFTHEGCQAFNLPPEYNFDCNEVYIRQDTKTGDIILSKNPHNPHTTPKELSSWDDYFKLVDSINSDELDDFMSDRDKYSK